MVETPVTKFLLSDDASLHTYLEGEFPGIQEIKARLLTNARQYDKHIADHHYRIALEKEIGTETSLGNLIVKMLQEISETFLYYNNGTKEIQVKEGEQTSWHNVLPFLPPLLLNAAVLAQGKLPDFSNKKDVETYYNNIILPVCKYTAIPSAQVPFLNTKYEKLHDLHIHLNGSVETDFLWQDFLNSPIKIYRHLNAAYKSDRIVAEQLEQESHLLKPFKFYTLLKIARKIRLLLFDLLITKNLSNYHATTSKGLLKFLLRNSDHVVGASGRHPFVELLPRNARSASVPMANECLMFVIILSELGRKESKSLESFFHFYLLIYGLTNRLVVQQPDQFGFDQFQKITLNRLRDLSEETYHDRFFQMFGNKFNNLQSVEGRISPKTTKTENLVIIKSVLKGWNKFIKKQQEKGDKATEPSLKLVMHFIKKAEDDKDKYIRQRSLRFKVWKIGKVLRLLLQNPNYKKIIVGIDAASNELHTAPEVFAPVFRMLRPTIKNFTFHVGEDFYHPLSGLRAIFETIVFIEMKEGDRIGHGTAMGIDPGYWGESIGKNYFIREGEWLDNLVFIWHLFDQKVITIDKPTVEKIKSEIKLHSFAIYSANYTLHELREGWLKRKHCPILSYADSREDAKRLLGYHIESEYLQTRTLRRAARVFKLYKLYHSISIRKKYDVVISLPPFEIISKELLSEIQLKMLAILNDKEIIIETLPTSNVRISSAKDFSHYHFLNWCEMNTPETPLPKIVVGTDDTGIFSTNLMNEYACIFELLKEKYPPATANTIIQELIANGNTYNFS